MSAQFVSFAIPLILFFGCDSFHGNPLPHLLVFHLFGSIIFTVFFKDISGKIFFTRLVFIFLISIIVTILLYVFIMSIENLLLDKTSRFFIVFVLWFFSLAVAGYSSKLIIKRIYFNRWK